MSEPRELTPDEERAALEAGERLRALFQQGQGAASGGRDCPPAEALFDAALGALEEREAQRLLDHSLGCAACGLGLRLARQLLADSGQALETLHAVKREAGLTSGAAPESPAAPRAARADDLPSNILPFHKAFFRRGIALAAALGAAALILLLARRTPEAPVYRADVPAISSLLDPGGSLPREAFVLRWSPLPAGTRYSLHVATPELQSIFTRGGLTEAQAQVPASALEKLPAGAQVVWRVTALLADGRRVESTAFLTAVR